MRRSGLILTLLLVLLHTPCHIADEMSCNAAPDNCTFDNNMCGWNGTAKVDSGILRMENNEYITSRMVCPSMNPSHCLTVNYSLSGLDTRGQLAVGFLWYLNSRNTELVESSVLITKVITNNPNFEEIFVDMNNCNLTAYGFKVQITVSQLLYSNSNVRLDNITYSKAPCPSASSTALSCPTTTKGPANVTALPVATVTTVTKTSTPTSAETTTTTKGTQTSSINNSAVTGTTTESPNPSGQSPSTDNVTPTAPASSTNVGVIVGVVVAVIVLLVIGIVVFVVITRRRGMDFWKTCFSKKKANETDDITMDSVPSTAVLNMNGQSSNAGRGYENTSLQRDDYYNVIGDADAASPPPDPSSEYAKVNKPPKKTTTANRTSYENTEDIPPSNLAPGFEYNHLDFGKRPGTKAGVKPTAAANYSHIHTPPKTLTDGAYSLAKNPGQNSASVNDATYQEPLKPAGVYHVLDRDQEDGRHFLNTDSANTDFANTESGNTADIYHVPDDGGLETGNYANENSSSNVYHDPYDSSMPRQYQNDANRYGNVEGGASSDVPHIPSSSSKVYHSIEERPENRPAKPQPPRKPIGVYELAKDPAAAAKKPTSPPKPNTAPHRPPSNTGTSVYHVLESPKSGMGDNYDLAGPIGDSLPSTSVYQLAEPTQNASHIQPSFSNDGDYNALDFNARNVPQKAEYVDTDPRAVYNHLNEGDGTYNETNKKPEVINDEYSHLS